MIQLKLEGDLQSFSEWLQEINAMPNRRVLYKKVEQMSDKEILDILSNKDIDEQIRADIEDHMPMSRRKIIINQLVD